MFRALLYLFLSIPIGASSQVDSILSLKEHMQSYAVKSLYERMLAADPGQILQRFTDLEKESRKKGAPILAQHFWSMARQHTINLASTDSARIALAIETIDAAKDKGWKPAEADWLMRTGRLFYEQGRYGPAFEYMLRGQERMQALGYRKYPHLLEHMLSLGLFHYYFGDYEASADVLKVIIDHKDQWPEPWSYANTLNTTALSFQHMERYDSALYYSALARDHILEKLEDTSYAVIVDGNRAIALRRLGRLEEAIELLKQDFHLSQRFDEMGSAVNAALELADIYMERGDLSSAETYIAFAEQHADRKEIATMRTLTALLAKMYRANGAYAESLIYLDSSQVFQDSLTNLRDAKVVQQAKQKIEIEHYRHALHLLEAKREKQVLIRNGLVIIIVLLGIASILWYHRRHIQRREELKIAELKNRLTQEELASAQIELQSFTKMLREKNAVIESIHDELNKAKNEEDAALVSADVSSLMFRTILTEDDWQQFRTLFEKVYPGYFYRMKEKFPDITPADMRLLALTKLHLSPKEMAAMLGISYDAIKKSRRRLRQRIDLPGEGSLEEVAESI